MQQLGHRCVAACHVAGEPPYSVCLGPSTFPRASEITSCEQASMMVVRWLEHVSDIGVPW